MNDPALGLAYLEMREVRSDMTPAQVAASIVSLREHTRVSGSEAEVVSMAVRVEQRLSRTQARLRTMDVRQAALRVVRQLEVSVHSFPTLVRVFSITGRVERGTSAREPKKRLWETRDMCSKAKSSSVLSLLHVL